jgi:hypothetical protein
MDKVLNGMGSQEINDASGSGSTTGTSTTGGRTTTTGGRNGAIK